MNLRPANLLLGMVQLDFPTVLWSGYGNMVTRTRTPCALLTINVILEISQPGRGNFTVHLQDGR